MIGVILTMTVAFGGPLADRAALIIGQNHGGDTWEALRHAEHDAAQVRRTLLTRGRFAPERVAWLPGAGVDGVRAALHRLAEGPAPDLLVVYYSGHADNEALRLGRERLLYTEFRAAVRAVEARSTVIIVDACHAEALRRGKSMRAFAFDAEIAWRGQPVEGEILLGSSSYGERAFEDDAIGGSVFTHHLLAALEGAADSHGEADGRITVSEAFAYADQMTRLSGHLRREGSQSPWIARDDVGDGPTLTFKHEEMGILEIPAGIAGRVMIRTQGRKQTRIEGEYDKPSDVSLSLWMAAGDYQVEVRAGHDGVRVHPVTVEAGDRATVAPSLSTWQLVPYAPGPERGKASTPVIWQASAGYQMAGGWLRGAPLLHGVELGIGAEHGPWQIGAGLGWQPSSFTRPGSGAMREAVDVQDVWLLLHGARLLHQGPRLSASLGLEGGGSFVRQEVLGPERALAHGSTIIANGRLMGSLLLMRGWSLLAIGRAGGRVYPLDHPDTWGAHGVFALSLGVARRWE